MEVDNEDFLFDESTMGEEWKDKLEEILQEHNLNQVQRNDVQLTSAFKIIIKLI